MSENPKIVRSDNSILVRLLQERGYKRGPKRSRSLAGRWKVRADIDSISDFEIEAVETGPILEFQRFYGLEETGEFDAVTTDFLLSSRCGVPDPIGPRALRTGLGGWPTRQLGYAFENFLPGYSEDQIRFVINAALAIWSNAAPLHFHEVPNNAHINIRFGAKHHGDSFPFQEGELAHAFFPDHQPKKLAGQVHFDTEENWSIEDFCPPDAKDLLSVAIHEIGHAIGLDHVGIRRSVMFANYQGMQRTLYPFDVEAVNSIYDE